MEATESTQTGGTLQVFRAQRLRKAGKKPNRSNGNTPQEDKEAERIKSQQARKDNQTLAQYVKPPLSLKEMTSYGDNATWHKACVEAKVENIIGYRVGIKKSERLTEDQQPDKAQREVAMKFLAGCATDIPLEEILKAALRDFENTGTLVLEVGRNLATQLPQKLFYMPVHTHLIHRTEPKIMQRDGGRTAYFWLYGEPDRPEGMNEVLRIFRPNHKSAYYGIPDYLAAVAAIVGDCLARDYNLNKFGRRCLADWACTFKGTIPQPTKDAIKSHFKQLADDDDYFMPLFLEGGVDGDAVKWQRLNDEIKDASWTIYRKLSRDEVLAVHRVPPDKISVFESSRFQSTPEQAQQFRDEVIIPRQRLIEFMFNRLLLELGVFDWELSLPVTDLTNEKQNADIAATMSGTKCFTVNEVRKAAQHDAFTEELEPYGKQIADGMSPMQAENLANMQNQPQPPAFELGRGRFGKAAVNTRLKKLEQRIIKTLGEKK